MEENKNFLFGNIVLGVALLMLININTLWDAMGPAAMGLWAAVAGLGFFLLMNKGKK